jgi:hypothetical protein
MRRLAAFAPAFTLLLPLSFASRVRAQQAPTPPASSVRASSAWAIPAARTLRLTPLRELGIEGLNLRLRLPGPLGPYVEGRLGDGMSASRPDGALMVPGTPVGLSGALGGQGAGLVTARGVDVGLDVRRFKGGYVSVALGLLRSTWPIGGLDAHDRLVLTNVSLDAAIFKVGVSF